MVEWDCKWGKGVQEVVSKNMMPTAVIHSQKKIICNLQWGMV